MQEIQFHTFNYRWDLVGFELNPFVVLTKTLDWLFYSLKQTNTLHSLKTIICTYTQAPSEIHNAQTHTRFEGKKHEKNTRCSYIQKHEEKCRHTQTLIREGTKNTQCVRLCQIQERLTNASKVKKHLHTRGKKNCTQVSTHPSCGNTKKTNKWMLITSQQNKLKKYSHIFMHPDTEQWGYTHTHTRNLFVALSLDASENTLALSALSKHCIHLSLLYGLFSLYLLSAYIHSCLYVLSLTVCG